MKNNIYASELTDKTRKALSLRLRDSATTFSSQHSTQINHDFTHNKKRFVEYAVNTAHTIDNMPFTPEHEQFEAPIIINFGMCPDCMNLIEMQLLRFDITETNKIECKKGWYTE